MRARPSSTPSFCGASSRSRTWLASRVGFAVGPPRPGDARPKLVTTPRLAPRADTLLQVGHDAVGNAGISVRGGRAASGWCAWSCSVFPRFWRGQSLAMPPARRRDRGSRGGMRAGVAGLRASGSRMRPAPPSGPAALSAAFRGARGQRTLGAPLNEGCWPTAAADLRERSSRRRFRTQRS
jgi:hypothetical protein